MVDLSILEIFQFLNFAHKHDDADKKDIELNERPSLPSLGKVKAVTWSKTFNDLKNMEPAQLAKLYDVGEEVRTTNQKMCDHYPLMIFGVGVNGYFKLIKILIVAMLMQSVIALFQISIFKNYDFHHRGYYDESIGATGLSRIDWTLAAYPFS